MTEQLTTATPMTFDAETYSALGTPRAAVRLPESIFDGTVNMPVMHQAVKAFLANQRQGNAMTKIRKFVTGGNQKPWKQKGTGRARQGSIRAPHWVGGGTVFGPIPRSYAQYVPRQVRALARKSAFNARARTGAVKVIDAFHYETPSTRRLVQLLEALGVAGRKVLILTDGPQQTVYLSGRNLPTTHVMPYGDVSTYHILWADVILVEAAAIGHTLQPLAESASLEPEARAARAAARTRRAESQEAASKTGASRKRHAAGSGGKRAGGTRKAAATRSTRTAKPRATKKSAAKKKKGK